MIYSTFFQLFSIMDVSKERIYARAFDVHFIRIVLVLVLSFLIELDWVGLFLPIITYPRLSFYSSV